MAHVAQNAQLSYFAIFKIYTAILSHFNFYRHKSVLSGLEFIDLVRR